MSAGRWGPRDQRRPAPVGVDVTASSGRGLERYLAQVMVSRCRQAFLSGGRMRLLARGEFSPCRLELILRDTYPRFVLLSERAHLVRQRCFPCGTRHLQDQLIRRRQPRGTLRTRSGTLRPSRCPFLQARTSGSRSRPGRSGRQSGTGPSACRGTANARSCER